MDTSTNIGKMHLVDNEDDEFPNLDLISGINFSDIPSSESMDSFFDELLRDTHACSHTHTCNPPGPDATHTHTCFHVHTKIVPPTSEEKSDYNNESAKKRGRDRGGNKEAVRKYRQRKKAHTASLEEEVVNLRVLNQQLLRRLQGGAALEAELARLRSLLVDIRGRIDGQVGCFPYQKPVNGGGNGPGSCMVQRSAQCGGDQLFCLRDGKGVDGGEGLDGRGVNGCDFQRGDCVGSRGCAPSFSCGMMNGASDIVRSYGNARRKS